MNDNQDLSPSEWVVREPIHSIMKQRRLALERFRFHKKTYRRSSQAANISAGTKDEPSLRAMSRWHLRACNRHYLEFKKHHSVILLIANNMKEIEK